MQLIIAPDSGIRCLYDETLPLTEFGRLDIARGSHVEPTSAGEWTAELTPVGGPTLGPFTTRSQALLVEQQWLTEHWLPASSALIPHPTEKPLEDVLDNRRPATLPTVAAAEPGMPLGTAVAT